MPTSDPLIFVRYLDVLLVVLAAPFVVLMGGPMLGYLVGGGAWIATRVLGVCAEYRERLTEARNQADEIVTRARHTAAAAENETIAEARAKREEMMEQTRRDIEAETRRAIQQIRAEVADLTVLATEKVTRKSLDSSDQKRLVEEALAELDFAALAHEERR